MNFGKIYKKKLAAVWVIYLHILARANLKGALKQTIFGRFV